MSKRILTVPTPLALPRSLLTGSSHQLAGDPGATFLARSDVQQPIDHSRSVSHERKAPAGDSVSLHREPQPVTLYRQGDWMATGAQADHNGLRLAVPDGIGHRLH